MRTIHKYTLEVLGHQTLKLPRGSQFLSVQDQRGEICVWAIVDPEGEEVGEHFFICGTGHPLPKISGGRLQFLGTVQQLDRQLVWHVFRLAPEFRLVPE